MGDRAPTGVRRRFATLVRLAVATVAAVVPLAVVGAQSASSPAVKASLEPVLKAKPGPAVKASPGPAVTTTFEPAAVSAVTLAEPAVVITPGQDVPDPFVVRDAGLYFMFASQEQFFGANVPLMVATSLTDWQGSTVDAMPTLPPWAAPGFTWSPDVRHLDGRWVMWFNASLAGAAFGATKCIGVATATSVVGPYRSSATAPLICQLAHLGSIDPRTFVDPEGRLWLTWKSDDNADLDASTHSTIWVQQLTPDGLQLLGNPTPLLTADQPWEGRIVEAPDMVFAAGHFWLFFSGNWFNQPVYSIGVSECEGPTGPCLQTSSGPWLSTDAEGAGPGEESLFYDGHRWWMLYAPFSANSQSTNPRPAALARVVFDAGGPEVVSPASPWWGRAGSPPANGAARIELVSGSRSRSLPEDCLGLLGATGCL